MGSVRDGYNFYKIGLRDLAIKLVEGSVELLYEFSDRNVDKGSSIPYVYHLHALWHDAAPSHIFTSHQTPGENMTIVDRFLLFTSYIEWWN